MEQRAKTNNSEELENTLKVVINENRIEKTPNIQLNHVVENVGNFAKHMKLFSLSMRSLYVENAVGTDHKAAIKLREIRDATRNDAQVYLRTILPVCESFISSLKGYFEYYNFLSFENWQKNLNDIISETEENRQIAVTLLKLHEFFLVSLKKKEDAAKIAVMELGELATKLKKNSEESKKKAQKYHSLNNFVKVFWPVNFIAQPLLSTIYESQLVKATSDEKNAEVATAALMAIDETLIPALKNFIEGLTEAAAFLSIIHNEICQYKAKGNKALEEKKELHYLMMKEKSAVMMSNCDQFFGVLPAVRTDFEAIPVTGTDENYVDKWLNNQMKIIEEQCNKRLVVRLLNTLPWMTSGAKSLLGTSHKKQETNEATA